MQEHLYEFLVLNKQISLPGIGTIRLKKQPATYEFTNRQFISPQYSFQLESGSDKPSMKLFAWLSAYLNISELDAIRMVNDFSFKLKQTIVEMGEASFENVGVFRRDLAGNYSLKTFSELINQDQPVSAEKVIREKEVHTVLVGEKETTSQEMHEYFADTPVKKDYTWIIALVLTFVSLMFIGWHFSDKGLKPSAAGNQPVIIKK